MFFSQLALSLFEKNEDRLRFGNKNEQVHFVLRSTCTIFVSTITFFIRLYVMENNEILKQIVSNLQILTDLTNSMTNSEMYPVSFFSQSFDLIQKIQTDIHILEANQVEMFAMQMKKHQALILSIHQQMRNIVPEKEKMEKKPDIPVTEVPVQTTMPAEEPIKQPDEPVTEVPPQTTKPIEEPIMQPEESVTEVPVQTTMPTEEPLAQPDEPETEVTAQIVKPIEDAIIRPSNPASITKETEVSAPPPPPQVPTSVPLSINDLIEKKKLSDLRKAFSLNDRFLYRRELFGGSEDAMNKVIAILNNKATFKESVDFLEEKLHWDFSNPIVKNFIKILEIRFL